MRFRVTPPVKPLRQGEVFVKRVEILEWTVENGYEEKLIYMNIYEDVNKIE